MSTAATTAGAYARLERFRWPDGPRCPHCAAAGVYFLTPRGAAGRCTRTGRPTARRVWKCAACRRQFSVFTATIWHGTRIPAPIWLDVLARCAADGEPPSVAGLRLEVGLSADAARRVRQLLAASCAHLGVVGALPLDYLARGLLTIDAPTAAHLRAQTAARRPRPLRQVGPSEVYD